MSSENIRGGLSMPLFFFFFNDPATTEIYTLSLHDALPICCAAAGKSATAPHPASPEKFRFSQVVNTGGGRAHIHNLDRKSTRLNSSHLVISYAVFCLKKKIHIHTPQKHAPVDLHPRAIARR